MNVVISIYYSQQNTTENGYGATDLQPLSEAGQILTVKQFRTKLNQAWAQVTTFPL